VASIGLRELKAKASEVLREVSQKGKEFIVTRHGKPLGKLVPVKPEDFKEKEKPYKKSLRNTYAFLPDLDEEDFQELKQVWGKRNQ